MVTVRLMHRHQGRHDTVREKLISGRPSDYVRYVVVDGRREPVVKEQELLDALPRDFLAGGRKVVEHLLMVDDVGGLAGSTAVAKPKLFRGWGKYFDAYSLLICREGRRRVDALKERR